MQLRRNRKKRHVQLVVDDIKDSIGRRFNRAKEFISNCLDMEK